VCGIEAVRAKHDRQRIAREPRGGEHIQSSAAILVRPEDNAVDTPLHQKQVGTCQTRYGHGLRLCIRVVSVTRSRRADIGRVERAVEQCMDHGLHDGVTGNFGTERCQRLGNCRQPNESALFLERQVAPQHSRLLESTFDVTQD
jgi:hypothetical protein